MIKRTAIFVLNKIKYAIAFVLWGCPICYNLFTSKTEEPYIMYCPNCNNCYDRRLWNKDE